MIHSVLSFLIPRYKLVKLFQAACVVYKNDLIFNGCFVRRSQKGGGIATNEPTEQTKTSCLLSLFREGLYRRPSYEYFGELGHGLMQTKHTVWPALNYELIERCYPKCANRATLLPS